MLASTTTSSQVTGHLSLSPPHANRGFGSETVTGFSARTGCRIRRICSTCSKATVQGADQPPRPDYRTGYQAPRAAGVVASAPPHFHPATGGPEDHDDFRDDCLRPEGRIRGHRARRSTPKVDVLPLVEHEALPQRSPAPDRAAAFTCQHPVHWKAGRAGAANATVLNAESPTAVALLTENVRDFRRAHSVHHARRAAEKVQRLRLTSNRPTSMRFGRSRTKRTRRARSSTSICRLSLRSTLSPRMLA